MAEEKESPIPEESPETESDSFSPIGIAMGVSIGTAIGVATDNLGMWVLAWRSEYPSPCPEPFHRRKQLQEKSRSSTDFRGQTHDVCE